MSFESQEQASVDGGVSEDTVIGMSGDSSDDTETITIKRKEEKNDFSVLYQPIVSLHNTKKLVGLEALLSPKESTNVDEPMEKRIAKIETVIDFNRDILTAVVNDSNKYADLIPKNVTYWMNVHPEVLPKLADNLIELPIHVRKRIGIEVIERGAVVTTATEQALICLNQYSIRSRLDDVEAHKRKDMHTLFKRLMNIIDGIKVDVSKLQDDEVKRIVRDAYKRRLNVVYERVENNDDIVNAASLSVERRKYWIRNLLAFMCNRRDVKDRLQGYSIGKKMPMSDVIQQFPTTPLRTP